MNSDLMIGVAGEHLVCFDLITRGFTCFMTEQGLPYDVIADINGKLVKVQVKTTRTHSETPQRKITTQHICLMLRDAVKEVGSYTKKTKLTFSQWFVQRQNKWVMCQRTGCLQLFLLGLTNLKVSI